ncbi:MAG: tetratricopeptide repeat protein [Myxococcales bacterium]|nr:tetratricopeptide repeat protein [Myxococcales bacterium]
MSRFPRRLIEQLGDGHARRLLESGRSDEPPARMVVAALAATSKSARASAGATSSGEPALRGLARSRSALVAGTLLAGGMIAFFAANELRGDAPDGRRDVSARPATTIEDRASVAAVDAPIAPTAVTESVATTSIADLPDAPSVRAPSARSIAAAARPESVTLGENEPAPRTADLLREANRLRAQGRWQEAGATYQRVIDLGPDSVEAYPAEIALANLELQLGRSAAALAHYEHVLTSRPAGTLSEEARWGKARALRAAGRHAEERVALEEFRARHPESPLAHAATQRLAEIGP